MSAKQEEVAKSVWRVAISSIQHFSDLPCSKVYYLNGVLNQADVQDITARLLADRVVEVEQIDLVSVAPRRNPEDIDKNAGKKALLEIRFKPGVMDPVAFSVQQAIRDLGYDINEVRTARGYLLTSNRSHEEWHQYAQRELANALIEDILIYSADELPANPFIKPQNYQFKRIQFEISSADDDALLEFSRRAHLFLNLAEMQTIQNYFRQQQRNPTDLEIETLAQTWSEHCVHKTFKSRVEYRGSGYPEEIRLSDMQALESLPQIERLYENLLADTIAAATRELNHEWCLSVFKDNAGIISFDEQYGVAFKVETHNHPSALEPYGGAATGVGGVIRDILGCGLGAKPIANTDVFCFAPPEIPAEKMPPGLFAPARSMREVVRGVRDYGNRMGIPTVNGAIHFDGRYLGNPLVYCGCVGLIPRDRIEKAALPGDRIVVIGGRTGRDGIHGATFSSGEMTDTHSTEFAHAVQIGNAITEKQVLDVLLQARDHAEGCLYHAVTDCGAGGLSSAVGEMAEGLGAEVHLDRVPLKYAGLRYDEIWISEAQERMVLAVPPQRFKTLLALCAAEEVEATDIGEFTNSGQLRVYYQQQQVGELQLEFLHYGLPKPTRQAEWAPIPRRSVTRGTVSDVHSALLEKLRDPNIASKEWVIRQYDHEVQAGSVIKPLMGPGAGPTDGAVVRPLLNATRGVVLSCGLCPQWADVDPYVMAVAAIDEAVRNNVCVGGRMARMALLDNFCWGGVRESREMGALVRAAQACYDAAKAYGLPFISGKDSLNNVYEMSAEEARRLGWPKRLSIPDTLLISAISVTEDIRKCRSSDLKQPLNELLMVEAVGSSLADYATVARTVEEWMQDEPGIRSVHDVSDGGWLVAVAEMAMGSQLGVRLEGSSDRYTPEELFAERLGCYVLEVEPQTGAKLLKDERVRCQRMGVVVEQPILELTVNDQPIARWNVIELRAAWRATFDWK
ncbi:MAG: Phosphoribosylformylglycinamidine synthase subunit PurL [Phycisphaerae bacterium]|nr:Phosphoribosylformylglycinamidine synthase subunit PurL [Phycisphaerae bacterium]